MTNIKLNLHYDKDYYLNRSTFYYLGTFTKGIINPRMYLKVGRHINNNVCNSYTFLNFGLLL